MSDEVQVDPIEYMSLKLQLVRDVLHYDAGGALNGQTVLEACEQLWEFVVSE